MSYSVKFESAALREFNKLDRNTQARLRPKIKALATDPRPSGVKKLQGFKSRYRIRVGDHRVIYDIHDNILRVLVILKWDLEEEFIKNIEIPTFSFPGVDATTFFSLR